MITKPRFRIQIGNAFDSVFQGLVECVPGRPWLLGNCRCDLLVGDLQGKDGIIIIIIIIIDDLISSGTTILRTGTACQAVATHALLIENALVVLADDARQPLIVTDTVASRRLLQS